MVGAEDCLLAALSKRVRCGLLCVVISALWPVAARAQDAGAAAPEAANSIVAPGPLVPLDVDYPEGATGEATVELALTIDAAGRRHAAERRAGGGALRPGPAPSRPARGVSLRP